LKTLLIDIETFPLSAFAWGTRKVYIANNQVITPPGVLSFAAEWYEKPHDRVFYSLWADGQRGMAEAAWDLMHEADAVITYNGDRFDLPWFNTLWIESGVAADRGFPAEPATIDLYKTVRSKLRLHSNKLEHVTKWLGVKQKIQTGGFDLWTGCMNADPRAQAKMERYNRNDVTIMRKVYEALRPLMRTHPNTNVIDGTEDRCPACKSARRKKDGTRPTLTRRYQRYRCLDCKRTYSDSRPLNITSTR
jgi:DNA polymerase elongation subunit (family B)